MVYIHMLTDDDIIRLTTAFSKVFATKDDLKEFAKKDDLKSFATKDDLKDIRGDLKSFATKDDLKSFATKDDLKGFATKDDLIIMEERMNNKFDLIESKIESNRKDILRVGEIVNTLGKEMLDYTKSYFTAHQNELDSHDLRIQTLEQFHA